MGLDPICGSYFRALVATPADQQRSDASCEAGEWAFGQPITFASSTIRIVLATVTDDDYARNLSSDVSLVPNAELICGSSYISGHLHKKAIGSKHWIDEEVLGYRPHTGCVAHCSVNRSLLSPRPDAPGQFHVAIMYFDFQVLGLSLRSALQRFFNRFAHGFRADRLGFHFNVVSYTTHTSKSANNAFNIFSLSQLSYLPFESNEPV